MSNIERLPGLVDAHVHLREPGWEHKEDFETGTKAAIAGGFTTIIDMPNNPVPTTTMDAFLYKFELTEGRIYSDLGFHFGAESKLHQNFYKIGHMVFGLKIYMDHTTGNLLIQEEQELEKKFNSWPRINAGPILVHAEAASLERAINLAWKLNQRIHACHVSLEEEIDLIRAAKEDGVNITCEVAPHHLFLTEEDARPEASGSLAIMKPPLSKESDRQALWKGIDEGVVDMIASDHAPHSLEEKRSEKPPFGVVGLETTLPLMLTAVAEGRLTLDRLVELISTNPKKIFRIREQKETYTEVDLKEAYKIDASNFYSKAKFSPFDGKAVTGRVVRVVLRGQEVFNGDKIIGTPQGRVIIPEL